MLAMYIKLPEKPAESISEVLNSKNFMGEHAPRPPYKSVLRTLIIKLLFEKKLGSVMHAAVPYLCPSNYPTLATPLPFLFT